jgi:hypothetical protein
MKIQAALILLAMSRSRYSPTPNYNLALGDVADVEALQPTKRRRPLTLHMKGPVRGAIPAGVKRKAEPKPKKPSPLRMEVKNEEKKERKKEEDKVLVSRSGRAIKKTKGFG